MTNKKKEIWIFGDYRNYFENRVTLQLLAKGKELADKMNATLCAVVTGCNLDEWVWEYTCHGAEKVYVADYPELESYSVSRYAELTSRLALKYKPEIILVGATTFGRELAPRVAKKLNAGLSADCIGLSINEEGRMVQTAPFFGGNLIADIVSVGDAPQIATVRPGVFKEIPHNDAMTSKKVAIPLPDDLPKERIRVTGSVKQPRQREKLESAKVVVCGGRGMGSKKKFKNLYDLAEVLDGEVGATRPVVFSQWAEHDSLVGQAGKSVKPDILFSFGVSGAIQHAAAITQSKFIIAINKNPNAAIMKIADIAIVADAGQVCSALTKELKSRIKSQSS